MAKHCQVIVLLLIICSSSWLLLKPLRAQPFCSTAVQTCAKPPTVDDLQVEEYLGKWYEVGSTATFKLLTEAGLACNQARYSASPQGNLSLLNSGLRVISSLAAAEVSAVNVAARGICGGAREACRQVAAARQLSQSFIHLTRRSSTSQQSLLQLATDLAKSVQAADQSLQELADAVSRIQQENGQISQANYTSGRSLQSSVGAIKEYVKEASMEQAVIAALASKLNDIRTQVGEMSRKSGDVESKAALLQTSVELGSIAWKVGATSSAVKLGLRAVEVGADALQRNGEATEDRGVASVKGVIKQPDAASAGKLEVTINGGKAPYWIIGVEKDAAGGYSAALVYSCSEVAGVTGKSLFVLSRGPQLEQGTLEALLAKARALGIFTDCEDPFLLTLQKGGDCGAPSSAS